MRTPAEIAECAHPGIGPIAREKRESLIRQINEFTESKIKEHLSRAAENARIKGTLFEGDLGYMIDRESITNIDIQLS